MRMRHCSHQTRNSAGSSTLAFIFTSLFFVGVLPRSARFLALLEPRNLRSAVVRLVVTFSFRTGEHQLGWRQNFLIAVRTIQCKQDRCPALSALNAKVPSGINGPGPLGDMHKFVFWASSSRLNRGSCSRKESGGDRPTQDSLMRPRLQPQRRD